MDIEKIQILKKNFKLRNIEVVYFDTLADAKLYILNSIPVECSIGIGHSITLQKMNITGTLLERGNIVYDKELSINREERKVLPTEFS